MVRKYAATSTAILDKGCPKRPRKIETSSITQDLVEKNTIWFEKRATKTTFPELAILGGPEFFTKKLSFSKEVLFCGFLSFYPSFSKEVLFCGFLS